MNFSQHGRLATYLREAMTCDKPISEQLPCYDEISKRVHVFPAEGTRANYPSACDGFCWQDNVTVPMPENTHDGEAPWTRNDDAALELMPAVRPSNTAWTDGPRNWTDWPGLWGASQHAPRSPGEQDLFKRPWDAACVGTGCPAQSARVRKATRIPKQCRHWFGADVAALLCSPRTLRRSIKQQRLGDEGRARIASVRRADAYRRLRIASAPGVVQVVGRPLRLGDRLVIRGRVPADARLFVRGAADGRLVEATFRATDVGPRTVVRLTRRLSRGAQQSSRSASAMIVVHTPGRRSVSGKAE